MIQLDIRSRTKKSDFDSTQKTPAPTAQPGCNLSVGVALNVRFTTNGMCVKNNTQIYVARTSNNRVIAAWNYLCQY